MGVLTNANIFPSGTTSGLPLTNIDTTSAPERGVVQTTGGTYPPSFVSPVIPPGEKEWRILLASERRRARNRGITERGVKEAIRGRRYGK